MRGVRSLGDFVALLHKERELVVVDHPVDPTLELPEIHRRVAAADGPALLFRSVKGSSFPLVSNLFGSTRRLELAFPNRPEQVVKDLIALATHEFPPKLSNLWQKRRSLSSLLHLGSRKGKGSGVSDCCIDPPDLEQLPLLQLWPEDGGSFMTLPLVYTEPVGGGPPNLGIYRIQRYDKETTGLHWQIAKGGGFHFHEAEKQGVPLPVTIFLGGPPALMVSAILPLPENVPELLMAGLLQGGKLEKTVVEGAPHALLSQCEFAVVGVAEPGVRRPEGPFGDHYGYYSLQHDYPVFRCQRIYHRKGAIYPATVVGKPRQEDYYIGNYLQELLAPLFPVVMPTVKDLWSYGETGFHSLASARIRERYEREAMVSAFRILGEGQLALTKFLLLTDQPVPLKDIRKVLPAVLERFRPERDLYLFAHLAFDTLDYTSPEINKGSKGVMLGVGEKIRDLPIEFRGTLPQGIRDARAFCPGCLVLEGEPWKGRAGLEQLCRHPDFAKWPLLVLVDNVDKALKNDASFLWTAFTRFEPAADIYAGETTVVRHHLSYKGPILIDARMKPTYPKEVLCDPATAKKVTQNWGGYFPQGMAMGESDSAHV